MYAFKLLPLFFAISLNAGQFSLLFYNDYFARKDQHFTNGICLSWLENLPLSTDLNNSNTKNSPMNEPKNQPPSILAGTSKKYSVGLSLSQVLITPKETTLSTPQYNDMPYVGYLNTSLYLFEWNEKSFREYRIELGVVGEEAGAEFTQNSFHVVIKNPKLAGWDTQLGTQYTANALFRYGETSWQSSSLKGFDMDWFNHFGLEAGNFSTNTFAGTMFRIGKNYRKNFNVHYPYLKEEASLLRLDTQKQRFGWSFSSGINTQLLAYSYILDEAKKEGYTVKSNIFNASLYAGTELYYGPSKLTFFYQVQSPYNLYYKQASVSGGFNYVFEF